MNTNEITIEKGVPLPTKRSKYPYASMEVGDSFTVEAAKRVSAANAANNYQRKSPGKQFTSRPDNDEKTMFRIWRVK